MAICTPLCLTPPPQVGLSGCSNDLRPGGISRFFWKQCDIVFRDIYDYNEWCEYYRLGYIGFTNEIKGAKGTSNLTKRRVSACRSEITTGREQVITFEDFNADDVNFSDFDFYNYLRRNYLQLHFGYMTCDGLFFGWIENPVIEVDFTIEDDVDGSSFFQGSVMFKNFDDYKPIPLPLLVQNLSNNCANLGYGSGGSNGSTITACAMSSINSAVVGTRTVIGAGPSYLTTFSLSATVPSGYTAEVRYRKVGTMDWTSVGIVGGVITNQVILSLTDVGTTWEFQIRTVCNGCNSAWSASFLADETVPSCCAPSLVVTNWINSFTAKMASYNDVAPFTLTKLIAHINGIVGGAALVETIPDVEATLRYNGTDYCDVATLGLSSGAPGVVVGILTLANRTQNCPEVSIGFLYEEADSPQVFGFAQCSTTLVYDDINNILICQ